MYDPVDARASLLFALGRFVGVLKNQPPSDLHALIVQAPSASHRGLDPGGELPPLPVNLRGKKWIDAFYIPLIPAAKIHYYGDGDKLATFRDLSRVALAALRQAFPDVDELARRVLYSGPQRDADHILADFPLLLMRDVVARSPSRRFVMDRWFWTGTAGFTRVPYYEDERLDVGPESPAPPDAADALDVTTFTADVFSFAATALEFAIGLLPKAPAVGPSTKETVPDDKARAVGPIAAFMAEQEAIEARRKDSNERSRLAELGAYASGAESEHPQAFSYRQYKAALEACEARHFGAPDSRTGAGLGTPARLWRWITDRLELWTSPAAAMAQSGDFGSPTPFWDTLVLTYGLMHELRIPAAPQPPYVPMSERESRDMLQCLANVICAMERVSEPPDATPPAAEALATAGTVARVERVVPSGPPRPRPKKPSARAIQCYRLGFLRGDLLTQAVIAKQVYGDQKKQYKVSRDIETVKVWIEAGNVLPPIETEKPKTFTVDPSRLDMGPRRDTGRNRTE